MILNGVLKLIHLDVCMWLFVCECQVNSAPFFLNVTGDIVGKILAWCSLLPIFIAVGFITLIVFRREIHTVSQLVYFVFKSLSSGISQF